MGFPPKIAKQIIAPPKKDKTKPSQAKAEKGVKDFFAKHKMPC